MAKRMTSKERVLTTLARREPDRVPVNYYGNADIDRRLAEHFGNPDLLAALGVDFRGVPVPYAGPRLHAEAPGIKVSDWGIRKRWVEHPSGGYWDYCDWPLAQATVAEIEAWPMPDPDRYDYSQVAPFAEREKDFCVTCGGAGWPDVINGCGMLRTMEQVLVDLVTDDEGGLRLIDRRNEIQVETARRTLEAGKGKIDLLCLGEDLGTQRGPTLSLALFRKHLRPRMQKFVDLAKAYGIPTLVHCCGSSSWAFDDFVEMGITAVETLQPEAADMAPAYLKSATATGSPSTAASPRPAPSPTERQRT